MNPYLDSQNGARIKIQVYLNSWMGADCLIDTGFSGGLSLPETFLSNFKQKPVGYQVYELADGSDTVFSIYKVKIRYKKIVKNITLFFTKSTDSLVGIEFLKGCKFILDLKKFQTNLE
ncbi:MAG: hypothetical protein ACD_57C00308G0006 [uncultured bacterium]|uniref:Uncharacterized protein n=1 Tax=Candidatus Woesebacteria bacterium RIFCSPHIGHO2_12_FULL_41_24 TaxID=1802510 RepID=A0A1F8AUY3_9BACT|nr:MAG: hypothetical protein ACD_57C00308G0006 [uncultured bacterium]OGM14578.1 MAG: hypothetical protein A2W15_01290 [Candidatus Woesebacteria bacterium RBG_16_41_13]OGM30404.1 MAG: hypothetical protein A2873_00415 [Candidatus Woesebacteria bacterium RIFCSPHIGHO2_01_FULL_42_80]OGM35450.1 MAG: hypothetical protein A3D84_05730 [Candidatus Woesebacteria bacterium RIFCSPHIGHO2_02_FULL_42_20]OGM55025.1 MAG: hypothetical protein A3E44_04715 [Candidatus Woesebacteria bacterium RIFCSPHIGHO2_12_FULL_41